MWFKQHGSGVPTHEKTAVASKSWCGQKAEMEGEGLRSGEVC